MISRISSRMMLQVFPAGSRELENSYFPFITQRDNCRRWQVGEFLMFGWAVAIRRASAEPSLPCHQEKQENPMVDSIQAGKSNGDGTTCAGWSSFWQRKSALPAQHRTPCSCIKPKEVIQALDLLPLYPPSPEKIRAIRARSTHLMKISKCTGHPISLGISLLTLFLLGSFMAYWISRVIFGGVLQHGSAIEHLDVSEADVEMEPPNEAPTFGTWKKGSERWKKGSERQKKGVRKAEKAMHVCDAYKKLLAFGHEQCHRPQLSHRQVRDDLITAHHILRGENTRY